MKKSLKLSTVVISEIILLIQTQGGRNIINYQSFPSYKLDRFQCAV